jgi:hypothetical protein
VKVEVPDTPGVSELVLRELVFVSLNEDSAEVHAETVFPRISRIPTKPPEVSASCSSVHTWTLSGRHKTHSDGEVEINLNRFLKCVSASIEGAQYPAYIGSLPHFTATPELEEPAFLTYTLDAQNVEHTEPQALNVMIKVMSWKHDGNPAPNVTFNWIAVARTARSLIDWPTPPA